MNHTGKSLVWRGHIIDYTGYAAAAREYLRAAESADILIRAENESRYESAAEARISDEEFVMAKRCSRVDVPNDAPVVYHMTPFGFERDAYRKTIGLTVFEYTGIPKAWVKKCNMMDEMWVASEYTKSALLASGVTKKVTVLAHPIDPRRFSPDAAPWAISNRREFAFLSVFEFTDRKAWRDLLRAYWSAFKRTDDVCLILKTYLNIFDKAAASAVLSKILKFKKEVGVTDGAPILIYPHGVTSVDMPGLYTASDCYVSMGREGFGLPFAEAMACGVPCIGPEAGGNRHFMNEQNSFLVKHTGDEPVSQEMLSTSPEYEGLSWAKHSWEHCAELMRSVVADSVGRKRIGAAGLEYVVNHIDYETVGLQMRDLL